MNRYVFELSSSQFMSNCRTGEMKDKFVVYSLV